MQPLTRLQVKILITIVALIAIGYGGFIEYNHIRTVQTDIDKTAIEQIMGKMVQVCAGEGRINNAYVFRYTSTSTDAYYQCVRVAPPTDTKSSHYYGIWINESNK